MNGNGVVLLCGNNLVGVWSGRGSDCDLEVDQPNYV